MTDRFELEVDTTAANEKMARRGRGEPWQTNRRGQNSPRHERGAPDAQAPDAQAPASRPQPSRPRTSNSDAEDPRARCSYSTGRTTTRVTVPVTAKPDLVVEPISPATQCEPPP